MQGVLVTGDGDLRQIAEAVGLEFHGIIWVLDELLRIGAITPTGAVSALETMLQHGARLPDYIVREVMTRWSGKSS